jgi:hypothetical protein
MTGQLKLASRKDWAGDRHDNSRQCADFHYRRLGGGLFSMA